ncbi:MAG: hypothetical protein ACJAYN_002658 [Bermanella sp.]|jgi:hypothetical protein
MLNELAELGLGKRLKHITEKKQITADHVIHGYSINEQQYRNPRV